MLIQWTHNLADQPSATWPAGVMLDSFGRPYRIDSDGQKVFINYGDWLTLAPRTKVVNERGDDGSGKHGVGE